MRKFTALIPFFLILAACGGEEGDPEETELCSPNDAAVGETVICPAAKTGYTEDCTLFFDGVPVDAAWDPDEQTVSFVVPPSLPGPNKTISFQCGSGDPKVITRDLAVRRPPPVETAECQDNRDCPGGTICQGETCRVPDGGVPEGGSEDPPEDEEGDPEIARQALTERVPEITPIADRLRASEIAGALPGIPLSAEIHVEKMFDTRIGLVKVHWEVQEGVDLEELYIYSNGFYRRYSDLSADGAFCGPFDDPVYTNKGNGTRRLLVHSDGSDLNEGSPNYNSWAPYLQTAERCRIGADNCTGYAAGGRRPPTCRIDLKKADGTFKKSGDIYTRVLVKDAVFTLYAKTVGEQERLLKSDPVSVPEIETTLSFDNLVDEAKIKVIFTAQNAIRKMDPIAGCETSVNSFDDTREGEINLEAECPLPEGNIKDITIAAYGIGARNSFSKSYRMIVSSPHITIKDAGNHKCHSGDGNADNWGDCKGTLDIEVKAWRDFELRQGSNSEVLRQVFNAVPELGGKTTKGIPSLMLSDNNGGNRTQNIAEKNEEAKFTFADVPRNHTAYRWRGRVTVNGGNHDTRWLFFPYNEPSFEIVSASASKGYSCTIRRGTRGWTSGCHRGGCDECPSGFVSQCRDHKTTLNFSWGGRHIREIRSSCGGLFDYQPSFERYDYQSGTWTETKENRGFGCTITAVTYNNEEIIRDVWANSWEDNC